MKIRISVDEAEIRALIARHMSETTGGVDQAEVVLHYPEEGPVSAYVDIDAAALKGRHRKGPDQGA